MLHGGDLFIHNTLFSGFQNLRLFYSPLTNQVMVTRKQKADPTFRVKVWEINEAFYVSLSVVK